METLKSAVPNTVDALFNTSEADLESESMRLTPVYFSSANLALSTLVNDFFLCFCFSACKSGFTSSGSFCRKSICPRFKQEHTMSLEICLGEPRARVALLPCQSITGSLASVFNALFSFGKWHVYVFLNKILVLKMIHTTVFAPVFGMKCYQLWSYHFYQSLLLQDLFH